jgi:hypothetical protein
VIEGVRDWLGARLGSRPRVLAEPGVAHPGRAIERHRGGHAWLVSEHELGSSDHFVVYGDRTPVAEAAGRAILAGCEQDYGAIREWFAGVTPTGLPFAVHLDAGAGGAFHYGCAGTEIHLVPDLDRAPGLLAAQVVEVFEAELRGGWDCARTNGEALSRVLAFTLHATLAAGFLEDELEWWRSGHPDRVNQSRSDDADRAAAGCGQIFLHYLNSQLGIDWERIIAAGGEDLGATYELLTGFDGRQGFEDFLARLESIADGGRLPLPASGNPFPIRG